MIHRPTVHVLVLLLTLLTACAPKAVPTPAPIVVTATPEAAGVITEAPVEEPTATLEPINLIPPVEVGSTFMYVDGSLLVAVPGGEFTMGRAGSTDNPERRVDVSDFWAYRYKVTNKQYALCVASGECSSPDLNDNLTYDDPLHAGDPVSGVTWAQADSYCSFVHGRLPTEAEWEKLARGPDGNLYPWGEGAPACDLLNFNNCVGQATDVNTYPQGKSHYGAYDMAGNLHEWVADYYDALYTRDGPTANPLGPDVGTRRSVRASSYKSKSEQVPSSIRFFSDPNAHRRDLGFRCVVEDPGYFAPYCEQIAFVGADQGGGAQVPAVVPTPDCPAVSGTSAGFCNNNVTGGEEAAHLNLNPDPLPAGTLFSVPAGCSLEPPGNTTNDYYCNSGGQATMQVLCTVPPSPISAGCGPGYTPDPGNPNQCNWTGGGTAARECLPGFTYDPDLQCCTSTSGAGDVYHLCPSSAPYYAGGICQPWPTSDYGPLISISVALGACTHDSGGGCDPQTDPTCRPAGVCPPPCVLRNGQCVNPQGGSCP